MYIRLEPARSKCDGCIVEMSTLYIKRLALKRWRGERRDLPVEPIPHRQPFQPSAYFPYFDLDLVVMPSFRARGLCHTTLQYVAGLGSGLVGDAFELDGYRISYSRAIA